MSEIQCECKKPAVKVCITHQLYLCQNHSSNHKCKQIGLKQFESEIKEIYKTKMTLFQDFKKQRTNFLYAQKIYNEDSFQQNAEAAKNLEFIFDKYLEMVKTKKNSFLKNIMDFKQDEMESSFQQLFNDKRFFELKEQLNNGKIEQMNKKFHIISHSIAEFQKNDTLIKTIHEIFEDLIKKFKEQFEQIQGSNYLKLEDIVKSSKTISKIYFDQVGATQIRKNIKKSVVLTQTAIKNTIMVDTFNELGNQNSNSDLNSDIESLKIEDMEIDSAEDQRPNRNLQARGTQLISNDIFKSSLNPKQHKLDRVKEQSEEEGLSGSDLSFEVDDIELEDDIDSIQRDYQEDFERNKNRFCQILDQVLFDVNCIGFFDKNERSKINTYFDQFKMTLNQLVGDLKSNFSKMQLIT